MIENELKYVLKMNSRPQVEAACGEPTFLRQGYLPGKARIRSKTKGKKVIHVFTYKLSTGDTLFEIEKNITAHEFEVLWPHTNERLTKLRYTYDDGPVHWDIDFFLDNERLYFSMAEAEMPEDMKEPPRIPKFLHDVMLYPVPRERTVEFTSKRCADPAYADLLMAGLVSEA